MQAPVLHAVQKAKSACLVGISLPGCFGHHSPCTRSSKKGGSFFYLTSALCTTYLRADRAEARFPPANRPANFESNFIPTSVPSVLTFTSIPSYELQICNVLCQVHFFGDGESYESNVTAYFWMDEKASSSDKRLKLYQYNVSLENPSSIDKEAISNGPEIIKRCRIFSFLPLGWPS